MKKITLLLLLIPFLLSTLSCDETTGPQTSSNPGDGPGTSSESQKRGNKLVEAIITQARENNLKPDLMALSEQTTALKTAVEAYCPTDSITGLDESKLQAAQSAWKEALLTLKKVEVFYFGPYSDKDYYPPINQNVMRYRLDFIPSNVTSSKSVNNLLGRSDAEDLIKKKVASETSETTTNKWSHGEIGFPALDYLLFASKNLKTKAAYCLYVREVSKLLESDVKKLQKRWWDESAAPVPDLETFTASLKKGTVLGKGFYYWLIHPGSDPRREIRDWRLSLQFFVDGLGHIVEFANGKNRLNAIKDAGSVQYPYSQMAVQGVLTNIKTLRRIYLNEGGDDSESLSKLVEIYIDKDKTKEKLDPAIKKNLDDIISALEGKNDNKFLEEAGVVKVSADMQTLATNLKQILTSLGLHASKSDADGD